jgi:hypothetical protein
MEWGITVKLGYNGCQPLGIATITPQWRAQLEVQGTAVETSFWTENKGYACQRVGVLLKQGQLRGADFDNCAHTRCVMSIVERWQKAE